MSDDGSLGKGSVRVKGVLAGFCSKNLLKGWEHSKKISVRKRSASQSGPAALVCAPFSVRLRIRTRVSYRVTLAMGRALVRSACCRMTEEDPPVPGKRAKCEPCFYVK